MQASLERYLKSKAYPKCIIRDRGFLTPEKSWKGRPGNCESKAKETTKPIQKFDKRRGRRPLPDRLAWRRNSTSFT